GNPKWRSLGDSAGALKTYEAMLAIARRLHEADPANLQAANDYAIALTRVAAVSGGRQQDRISMLRESLAMLLRIEQVNPQNAMNRFDVEHGYLLLGDALAASDRSAEIEAYEQSVSLGEALIAGGVILVVPDMVSARQRLGLLAASDGRPEEALKHA